MYRIELSPGEETALRSIEELAIGIRNGVITTRARIWHGAGQQWLPITLHPHYRLALNHQAAQAAAAEAAVVPIVRPTGVPAAAPAPPPASRVPGAEQPKAGGSVAEPPPGAHEAGGRTLRSGRRPIRLAMLGGVLALGTHVVLSATVPSGDTEPRPARASRPTAVLPAVTTTSPAATPSPPASPTQAPRRSPAKPFVGRVVRGPGLVAPPPLRAAPLPDSAPSIAPAPADVNLAIPKLSADSLGLPKVAIDSAAPSGMSRILNAIAPKP